MKFDFGNGAKDPFKSIRFFSKHDDKTGKEIPLATVSSFLPEKFKEIVVRFYYKGTNKFEEARRLWLF